MKLTLPRCTAFTLVLALCFISAGAQVKSKQPAKKAPAKTVRKTVAAKKPAARPARPVNRPAAARLGDAATKVPIDTAKRGKSAAPETNTNNSLSEEIVVTTTYKPVLADAVKIRRNPNLEEVTPFKAPLEYNALLDKKLTKDSEIRPLVAMPLPAERDTIRYNNYIKGGLGSLKTTYGELYLNNGQDEALQGGVYAKHFAQQGNEFYKQNSMKDEVGLFGKSVGQTNSVSGRIDYDYRNNYFYGYNENNPPATRFTPQQQHFNHLGAEGELTKNYKDTDRAFTYALKLKGYVYSDAYNARENNVVLSGFINQTIHQFYAGLSGSLDVATQKDSLYSINNSLIRLNPYLKFQGDNYKIDAGVNIVDQFGYQSNFYIFPAAKLEFQVVPSYVRLFAEAKGDVNRTSLYGLSVINPFIGQNIPIRNSVDQLDLAAGLKGTIIPGLSFKVSVFRNSVKYLPLLESNFGVSGTNNKFTVVYDNGRARVTGLNGELDYKLSDDFNLFGRAEFKNYSLASEKEPWNLPKFKLTAGTVIHINGRLDINGSLLIRGNTIDPLTNPLNNYLYTRLSSYADLSAGAQYKINQRFAIFVQANNILNATEQNWVYYPNYGFNIFGGAGFSF